MNTSIKVHRMSLLTLFVLAASLFMPGATVQAQTPIGSYPLTVAPTPTVCYNFATNLGIGYTGADVVALQTWLIAQGFDIPSIRAGFTPKGYFGVETSLAVKKYQTAKGIEATGFVGPLTRASINMSCERGGPIEIGSPMFELVSTSIETSGYDIDSPYLSARFKVKVSAFGDDVLVSSTSPASLVLYRAGVAMIPGRYAAVSTVNETSSNLTPEGYYLIEEGTTNTFSVTYSYVAPSSVVVAGQYMVKMESFKWKNSQGQTYWHEGGDDWKTSYAVLNGRGVSTQTSMNVQLISTNAESNNSDVSDMLTFKFKMKVAAVDGSVKISTSSLEAVDVTLDRTGVVVNTQPNQPMSHSHVTIQDNDEWRLTPDGYYLIEEGESHDFTITYVYAVQSSAQYRVTLNKIMWKDESGVTHSYKGEDNWKTLYVFGKGQVITAPSITSTSAKAAGNLEMNAGGDLAISGTNLLGGDSSSLRVYIGGQSVPITQKDNTLLYVNVPSNLTLGSYYDVYVKNDRGTSNTVRVKVVLVITSANRPPVIKGVTAPTVLKVNDVGTWTVMASDPENGSLSYSIDWGEATCPAGYVCSASSGASFSQTSSFTHSYATAGTYTVKVTVTDAAGLKAQTSSTVRVDTASDTLYSLNIKKAGTGTGIVMWKALECGITCSTNVVAGTEVTLTVIPQVNSFFSGWSGACTGTSSACTVTMNENKTVVANFSAMTSVACPAGYICTPSGQVTACPAGYTCTPTTLSCPSGYTCYTKALTTPTVTATTPYITIVSPRYENLKIGVKHQIKWKDSREKGKGLPPVYYILITGSNGKQVIADNLAASKWCDDVQCYYDWTPTTASTNNQISIYDTANDPNAALIGRSTIFNIEAGSPVSQTSTNLNASIWQAVKDYMTGIR
ncbi:MAG: Flagellar hook-length control protein FliK [Parcubacteria bacterium C7867-002]|nr:MAG: Flagellar hook-length control protein FliK [Parcubacteria bacterium C7867-002]